MFIVDVCGGLREVEYNPELTGISQTQNHTSLKFGQRVFKLKEEIMSKEAAAFLANKELVLDNPMTGYTIPYAYLLTLLEEFAKSQVAKKIYVTNGKYGQRYYKADTKEQREKACLSILKENYEMDYYWDRALEAAEDIIKSNNGREAVRFVFDRCDHEYEGICTETLE